MSGVGRLSFWVVVLWLAGSMVATFFYFGAMWAALYAIGLKGSFMLGYFWPPYTPQEDR